MALPTPLSPGALPVLPYPAAPGALPRPTARTWARQDPKTLENKPAPFFSPRNAGCRVTTDLSLGTAQLLPVTRSRYCRQRAPWPCCRGGCYPPAPPWWCRGLRADNGREGTTCARPCPPAVTHATGTLAAWASLKRHGQGDAERAAPPGAPGTHPMAGRGLPGPLPRSAGGGLLRAEPLAGQVLVRAEALGGRRPARSLSSVVSLPCTHAPSRPLYAQQKGGTSVTICIANQAAPAASGPATCTPHKATAGRSGAGRTGALWAGAKTPTSPMHRCPWPTWDAAVVCSLFPRGGSRQRHAHTGDAGWVQPDAGSRRRLLSVSLLLNQTQRTFPDSARACSGITHRQACSGQRRA